MSEFPADHNERSTIAPPIEHASPLRPEKRKTQHTHDSDEPHPPKRLRPTAGVTKGKPSKGDFWTLPEELMQLVCQHVRVVLDSCSALD